MEALALSTLVELQFLGDFRGDKLKAMGILKKWSKHGTMCAAGCLSALVASCILRKTLSYTPLAASSLLRAGHPAILRINTYERASYRDDRYKSITMQMKSSNGENDRWQDLAERLFNPFVSPFDKPVLFLKLAEQAPQVTQTLVDVAQGKEEPEEVLGSRAQQQVRGVRALSRQLTEDIIPDAIPEVRRLLTEFAARPQEPAADLGVIASSVAANLLKRVDDLTANGRLPSPPSISDIAGEVKQIFESTPQDLETPSYSVIECTSDFEIREYAPVTVASIKMQTSR